MNSSTDTRRRRTRKLAPAEDTILGYGIGEEEEDNQGPSTEPTDRIEHIAADVRKGDVLLVP